MHKFLMVLIVSFSSGKLLAEVPKIEVNCDDVIINNSPKESGKSRLVAFWKDPAVFPNPPKSNMVGDSDVSSIKKFQFSCPSYSLSYDGNIIEIKGITYEDAVSKLRGEIPLYYAAGYEYPNIKQGYYSFGYEFDLRDFLLKSNTNKVYPGTNLDTPSRFYSNINTIFKGSILGYKVNNGELKPLLYEQQVSYYYEDFENAETIDIFHKINSSPSSAIVQRIFINKSEGLVRIYYKYPFPIK